MDWGDLKFLGETVLFKNFLVLGFKWEDLEDLAANALESIELIKTTLEDFNCLSC